MIFVPLSQFHAYPPCLALVGVFNQEKAFVIVKYSRSFVLSSIQCPAFPADQRRPALVRTRAGPAHESSPARTCGARRLHRIALIVCCGVHYKNLGSKHDGEGLCLKFIQDPRVQIFNFSICNQANKTIVVFPLQKPGPWRP